MLAYSSISFAANSYSVIYGIDKNSIKFTNETTTPVEPDPAVTECDDNISRSLWTSGSISYQTHTIQWYNTIITTGGNYQMNDYTADGYHYTKGEVVVTAAEYKQYKVCRVAVTQ